ncbi:hypothetical protein HU200_052849 [Digitaria exilis]|uniref:Uncharacterized protein n=1 Tax=Digitaria exilis TaxID=1010633 RepID=A0A835ANK9_9POAL|nr:hypothetical protein HU200_052849 [Digitaria exilis]
MSPIFWAFYMIIWVVTQFDIVFLILLMTFLLTFVPPALCLVLSLIRLMRQDYGSAHGDPTSKANLKAALNIFYSLAVAQSVLYIFWISVDQIAVPMSYLCSKKYGYELGALEDYITETKRKCIRDMSLYDDWNLITYALSLLDSDSPCSDDYCSGLRILNALIEEKVPVNQLMTQSSRQRIQKLISMLGWRRPTDRETRELAARILTHLASDLNLADFPGALESVCTLLETHSYKKDQESLHFPLRKNQRKRNRKKSVLEDMMDKRLEPLNQHYMKLRNEQGIKTRQGVKEELILQGLRIVENLAHSERNCTEIYKNKDLLSKIIAPVSSDKFIEEVETNGGCSIRAMDGTLKVVSRLIGTHGDIGKNMRRDIVRNTNNLVAILGLNQNSSILGLQTRATEILAQLFLDETTNLDRGEREKFIQRLLHFFISEEWMTEYLQEKHAEVTREAPAIKVDNNIILPSSPLLNAVFGLNIIAKRKKTLMEEQKKKKMEEAKEIASQLKAKSGEALALLLSAGSPSDSNIVMNFTRCGDVKHCLTKMLDSKITTIKYTTSGNEVLGVPIKFGCGISTTVKCTTSGNEVLDAPIKIGCRISAAEILKHLCAHSTGGHSFCKAVLSKVLEELLHINTTGTELEAGNNVIMGSTSASRRNDVETPPPPSHHQDEPQIPGSNKQQCDKRRFQAALLSLYAAIRPSYARDFAKLIVEQLVAINDFPGKIKVMIKENSYGTPACLAMLKIICEMVTLLVQHGCYIQDFKDKKIIDALSEASKTVASLEGCMLFAGMDVDSYGVPLKPVSSALVEKARELLDSQVANDSIPGRTSLQVDCLSLCSIMRVR